MTKASNVILVHGAWADGSSWSKVIPLLLARGLRVTAVQLPLTSMKDDVATVKRALALEDRPVMIPRCPHSYTSPLLHPMLASPSARSVRAPSRRRWGLRPGLTHTDSSRSPKPE